MWFVAINPSSGGGNGAIYARRVLAYLSSRDVEYQVFSANSAEQLRIELEGALDQRGIEGVIAVGLSLIHI